MTPFFALHATAMAAAVPVEVCSAGCPYTTIQIAILAGHTHIILTATEDYPGFFVVDAPGQQPVFIEAGPYESPRILAGLGPAAQVDDVMVTIEGVDLVGSSLQPAAAVDGFGGTLELVDVDVSCINFGAGGIDVRGGALTMQDGSIVGCSGPVGGAIEVLQGGVVTLTGTTLSGNEADTLGGAVFAQGSTVDLTDVLVTGNQARSGGGLWGADSTVVLSGTTTFDANVADQGRGGGMCLEGSNLDATGAVVFRGNTADDFLFLDALGGGLALLGTNATLDSVTFENNWSALGGAGVWIEEGSLTGNLLLFDDNGVDPYLFAPSTGGGIGSEQAVVDLLDSTFSGNAATDGGHLFVTGGSVTSTNGTFEYGSATLRGGALFSNANADILLVDGILNDNRANTDGGAIAALGGDQLELNSVTVVDNSAGQGGGAVSTTLSENLTVIGGVWTENTSMDGGALHADRTDTVVVLGAMFVDGEAVRGGAIFASQSPLTVQGATFDGTHATGDGGAIYAELTPEVDLAENLYCRPTADYRGGAVHLEQSCAPGGCAARNERIFEPVADVGAVWSTRVAVLDVAHATVIRPTALTAGTLAHVEGNEAGVTVTTSALVTPATDLAEGTGLLIVTASNVDGAPTPWLDPSVTSHPTMFLSGGIDGELVCGADLVEFRIHPDSLLVNADRTLNLGAYGGPNAYVAEWGDDTDNDTDPWPYDCDDGNDTIGGTKNELCFNNKDDDCDGRVDVGGVDPDLLYPDVDGDGFANGYATPVEVCTGQGFSGTLGDCDDGQQTIHPGAPELCNDVDDDCDGLIDNDPVDGVPVVTDADGDGFAAPGAPARLACSVPEGSIEHDPDAPGDCDDGQVDVHPGATEIADDGIDQDCDDNDAQTWLAGGGCGCRAGVAPGASALVALLRRRAARAGGGELCHRTDGVLDTAGGESTR